MFEIKKTKISGCLELIPNIFDDKRGLFVKVFHQNAFASAGLETNFTEEYYSKSIKGVIRGLHFQIPPKDHVKVCYCVQGSVFDVVLDLRLGSPTFGEHEVFSLTAKDANMVYIPKGMAHGFCSLSESSILVYKTSTVYDANYDSGIRWDSAGIQWPTESPIMSDRDKEFIDFQSFKSPFGPALL
tara:strand:- start:65 stop:619 length:555 start_codon:yes stop_codon:yes gene_type:complete